jgi:signal transduction histidine kinase
LTRFLEKAKDVAAQPGVAAPQGVGQALLPAQNEFASLVGECATLIEREVATLKALVDEFSQFARFPTARPAPADINSIVASALDVFSGRLEGIRLRSELARDLPAVKADGELMRRVVVNLIDNAAEALEGSQVKELSLATRFDAAGETVEVVVADTGHGISPEDKDKLFLPRFSTRDRGTGLGLAIAARIVAEHHGTIRVEDNVPFGARFIVQLPIAEAGAPAQASAASEADGKQ